MFWLAIVFLYAITGAYTPACLSASNTSVEAVTPPSVGKELQPLYRCAADRLDAARYFGTAVTVTDPMRPLTLSRTRKRTERSAAGAKSIDPSKLNPLER